MEHLVVKVVLLGDSGYTPPRPKTVCLIPSARVNLITKISPRVGKSSLLTRFVDQRFSGAYKATIGAVRAEITLPIPPRQRNSADVACQDFVTHDIVVDGRDVTLQVWVRKASHWHQTSL